MKKALLFCVILTSGLFVSAQRPDYNEIILPQQADSMIVSAMGLSPYEERLVQLAWQNYPSSEIYNSRIRIAERKVTLEKFNWTDDIRASFNFNQRNIQAGLNAENANNFFPWYNFGVLMSIGSFVKAPLRTSIAR